MTSPVFLPLRRADLLLALVVIFAWGVNFAVIKVGVADVPPLLLGALRFLLAAFPAVLLLRPPKVPLRLYLLYGMTISVGQFALLFSAIHVGMPTGLASLVLQSQSFFTMLFAAWWLKEHWRANQLAGLMLAIEPLADRVVAHTPAAVEAQIGDAVLARTRAEGRMITDGPAFEALQTIGKRLARPGETLQFHLAGRADINAFAAPGGVVVVYSGLMKKAASAEEVAGVLAHEIAHVELRHSLRQLVKSAGLRVILAAAAGDYAALGGWAAQLGELKFSRDAEREADARGLERLAEARIAPGGMLRFFETLAQLEAERPGQLPALFSTHPATAERLTRLRAAVPPGSAAPTEAIAVDWPAVQRALAKE